MLYKHIGLKLRKKGLEVHRINLSLGDWLHWHGEGCVSYRGTRKSWPAFIRDYMQREGITDLVLHSDSRWYHKHAVTIAKELDIQVIVTELGLLRPGWLTLERDGLGLNSHFPDNPEQILSTAQELPEISNQEPYRHSFWIQALYDTSYNYINAFCNLLLYPHFRRHTPHHPLLEYPRWIPRLLTEKRRNRHADDCIARVKASDNPYFVFPLQLSGDFQIRSHSPFPSMREAIELVLSSFADHAPLSAQLIVKQHPSDSGLDNHKPHTLKVAERLGISERIFYVDGGSLDEMTRDCNGVVIVNSTAGIEALQQYVPVKTLAPTLYDMANITHQGELDAFWKQPQSPQKVYVDALIKLLRNATQVKGALYGEKAIEAASENISQRIADNRVSMPGAYLDYAPRQAKAQWKQN